MLSEYNFEIKHKAGSKLVQADFLSRNPGPAAGKEETCEEDRYLPEISMISNDLCWNCGETRYRKDIFFDMGHFSLCERCNDMFARENEEKLPAVSYTHLTLPTTIAV